MSSGHSCSFQFPSSNSPHHSVAASIVALNPCHRPLCPSSNQAAPSGCLQPLLPLHALSLSLTHGLGTSLSSFLSPRLDPPGDKPSISPNLYMVGTPRISFKRKGTMHSPTGFSRAKGIVVAVLGQVPRHWLPKCIRDTFHLDQTGHHPISHGQIQQSHWKPLTSGKGLGSHLRHRPWVPTVWLEV